MARDYWFIQWKVAEKQGNASGNPAFALDRKSFFLGLRCAIEAYAIWKDGEQTVGILRMPLKDALREVDWAERKAEA